MNKQLLTTFFLFLASFAVIAQNDGVLIDYSVTPPARDASAVLQLNSTNQGILIPRLTYAQEQAIVSPASGLMVFNTTSQCLDVYTGGAWQSIYCGCPNLDVLQAISGNTPVCAGTNQTYSVPGISGASSYTWTVTGSPTITGNGSSIISFNAPSLSTYTVSVTATNGCGTSSVSQSRVINCYTAVPPTPVFTSSPAGICEGGSYNYSIASGFGPNGTGAITYTWTITASGSASATLTANSQTAVAGTPVTYTSTDIAITLNNIVAAGNITVSVVGNNTCGSSITPLSLTRAVDQFTTANAGADQTVCATTATLAGNTPITGGGTWTLVSGSGTITTPTSPTSGITGLGLGNNTFRWTVLNGSCTNSQDDVIIARNDFTSANAGPDQTVCATTATFAGNTPLTGGGTWTLVSGNGTITTPTSPTSGVTGLGLGANTFRWTLLNGVCADSQDDVVITSDQFTAANAGPDQTLCATSATLAGNTPLTGGGTWTLVNGTGTITTPTSPSSGITGLGLGANTFRWTLLNGVCANSQDDVIITRNDFTTSNAGPDQTVCATTATMAGNAPLTGSGTWTLVSGTGTITTPTSPTSGLTGLGVGANTFRWTLLNGVCTDSQDDVVITRDQLTNANAGPDQAVCATTATLAGNTPTTGGGTWTLVSGTGSITTPTSPTSGLTGLGLGANTFRWTLLNGVCADSQDDVVITRDDYTLADAGPDQTFCGNSTTLAGNTPISGGGTWTRTSGTGTITTPTSPTSTVTGLGVGANTFRWTFLNGSCSDSFDEVVITSQNSSVAPTGISGTTTICSGSSTTLTVTGGSAGTGAVAQWFTGSCGGTSAGTGNSISVSPTSNTTYYVRYSGTCNTTTCASVTVTVNQFTASNAGPDQAVCATTATLAGNTPSSGGGTWTRISGAGTITTPTSPTSGITGLGVGANVFRWTLLNGVCTDSQDDVTITGQSSSTAPTGISGTTAVCNGTSTTLTLTGGSAGTGATAQWFTGSCGGTSAGTGNSITVTPTTTTTYYVRYSGTCNTTTCASVTVTVYQASVLGTVSNAGPIDFCSSTGDWSAVPITVSGHTGTVEWQWGSSNGTWNGSPWVTGTSPGYCCFPKKVNVTDGNADRVRWRVVNGTCPATAWSSAILLRNRYNEAPTSLTTSASNICAGSSVTLTANFPSNINILGRVEFYTGSCGGTYVGFAPIGNNVNSCSITITPPSGTTTTYYARYVPGTGTGCSNTGCQSVSVTVASGTYTPGSQTFNYTGGNQTFTVPACTYSITIEAYGASGGGNWWYTYGGYGARMRGTFSVTPGQSFNVRVGGQGGFGNYVGGGGGGSYVTIGNTPYVVAGGGGGRHYAYQNCGGANIDGTTSNNGNWGYECWYYGWASGAGGTGGGGGGTGSIYFGTGAGGGGMTGNGANGPYAIGGRSYTNGSNGGAAANCCGGYAGAGGYGGGGGGDWYYNTGAGGGGGYSGGGGGDLRGQGGGGGSYNSGSNQSNSSGANPGNGRVVISW
ncbi:MAG: hypothetical protein POELPBGB_00999 [Bacteroidia bacterium]|nr:hypothetical protein [Bacteroidia bacterium]